MNIFQKASLFLLRVGLGIIYFYAGLSHILNKSFTAAGYLKGATTFHTFYAWLADPTNIGWINAVNKWALLLLGVSLLLGLFVRVSVWCGIVLMFLYYFVILHFPYVGTNYLLVDEHIIFAIGLLMLNTFSAGRIWGLDGWCATLPWCKKNPKIRKIFG